MATKYFIIKLHAEDERDLDTVHVREELIHLVGFSSAFWLVGFSGARWVEDSSPAISLDGVKLTGKVSAIKYIRSLLDTSLIDSEAMVDAATALGTFHMHHLIIDHTTSPDGDVYTITDTR